MQFFENKRFYYGNKNADDTIKEITIRGINYELSSFFALYD